MLGMDLFGFEKFVNGLMKRKMRNEGSLKGASNLEFELK